MYRGLMSSLLCWVMLAGSSWAGEPSGEPHPPDAGLETALCSVCRVHEGETEAEPIRASEEFGGETYHFCSESCRERFLEAPQAYVTPVFPRPAPAFTVLDLEGRELTTEDLLGHVTLLDFWATWCLPCVTDLPKLTALHKRYGNDGFQVLGVSIDEGKKGSKKVEKMLRKKNVEHPVYMDGEEASAWGAFWVRAIPAQFLIDREGRIVAQWSGVIDLVEVEAAIAELLEDSGETS